MKKSDRKYYESNYETITSSVNPIQIDSETSVSYKLTKRKGTIDEYIVWMNIVTDMSEFDMPNAEKVVKAVVFSKTDLGAIETAFKRYLKGNWRTFKFGKIFKV